MWGENDKQSELGTGGIIFSAFPFGTMSSWDACINMSRLGNLRSHVISKLDALTKDFQIFPQNVNMEYHQMQVHIPPEYVREQKHVKRTKHTQ